MTSALFNMVKPTIVLLFHAADILFSLGIVILMCIVVVVLFSTLARRLIKKCKSATGLPARDREGESRESKTQRRL